MSTNILSPTEKTDPTYIGSVSRTGFSLNVLELHSGQLADLPQLLEHKIVPNQAAYRQRAFVLDIAQVQDVSTIDFPALQQLCLKYEILLIGLCGITDEKRAQILAARHIPIVNSNKYARVREENLAPKVVEVPVPIEVPIEVKVPVEVPKTQPLTVISRTIHSGETIGAPGNSVVIFGSVGPGARVVASHNIIVLGDINGGEVYAGNPANPQDPGYTAAFIYAAGKFNPSIISIAGIYQTAEDMEHDPLIGPLQGKDVSVVVSLEGTSLRYWQSAEFAPRRQRRL